jgi:hypothetical protein
MGPFEGMNGMAPVSGWNGVFESGGKKRRRYVVIIWGSVLRGRDSARGACVYAWQVFHTYPFSFPVPGEVGDVHDEEGGYVK